MSFYECAALGMRPEQPITRSTPKRVERIPASNRTKVDAITITNLIAAKSRLAEIKEAQ